MTGAAFELIASLVIASLVIAAFIISQWQFINQDIRSDRMSSWHNEHIMQWYRRRIKTIINSHEVQ